MSDLSQFLSGALEDIRQAGLLRELRPVSSAQEPQIDGLWNFSSNDYLGLATHPALRSVALEVTESHGTGSGASRLIGGTSQHHEALEEALADFKGAGAALTFSTGYAAALGSIPALVGSDDVIVMDKLCHACLIDGARLSGAQLRVFPHNDLGALEDRLRWARDKAPGSNVLVLVESVYSMDGDVAPLREMVALKEKYGAWMFLDEAHGVGVLGERGRGLANELGVGGKIEIQMGTLGKALGSAGAYICGSASLREYLINTARSFIFSTAPPASQAAASRAAVLLLRDSEEGPMRIARLHDNMRWLCQELGMEKVPAAILPIILGAEQDAVAASQGLLREGMIVPAIRFPTVARGKARLRLTVSSDHSRQALEAVAMALRR